MDEEFSSIREALTQNAREKLQRAQSPEGQLGDALRQTGDNLASLVNPQIKPRSTRNLAMENQISAYDALQKAASMGMPQAKDIQSGLKTFGLEGDNAARVAEWMNQQPDLTENNYMTMIARGRRELGIQDMAQKAQSSIGQIYADEQAGLVPAGTAAAYQRKATVMPKYTMGGGSGGVGGGTPAGPASASSNPLPNRKLSEREKKELFEARDVVNSGENTLNSIQKARGILATGDPYIGTGANLRAGAARLPVIGDIIADPDRGADTTVLTNLATEQTLSQLKAIFGGMPTEGERAILLQMQSLPTYTKEEQTQILSNAEQAIQRRIQNATESAESVRTGEYMRAGAPVGATQGGRQVIMVSPDGQEYEVDPDEVEEATANGWKKK